MTSSEGKGIDLVEADASTTEAPEKVTGSAEQEICGNKTFYSSDRGYWHEPLTKAEANELWASAERGRLAREQSMPDTQSAISALFQAQQRLKELGWREAQYCPKDGSHFEVIEPGSTGIFRCHYLGQWPNGHWWIDDEDGGCTSSPILFRLYPEDEEKYQAKLKAAREAYSRDSAGQVNFSNESVSDAVQLNQPSLLSPSETDSQGDT